MTREVCPQQAFPLDVNGQNILVHLGRSIIITVSVKCHSGKNPENGIPEEHHPKSQLIYPEAVSIEYFLIVFVVEKTLTSLAPLFNCYLALL